MTERKSSYRQIMKATSLFGGVQVFNIIVSIIRSKFIAILLGPEGMGIAGLLRSTIQLIGKLTNMGIGVSAVKNVAAANATDDQNQIATTVIVLRRLVWITGLMGAFVSFFMAPWLSEVTFGNIEYTFAFRWLSLSFVFGQISSGQFVLLQGLRKLQYLAKANIYGSILGLLITIPIYYVWGIDGIVPVMLLTSLVTLLLSFYFSNKIQFERVKVSKERTIEEGRSMVNMGIMISLSGLFTMMSAYLIRIFISNTGSVADVGLYTAGFAIIETYTGMVFSAMGTDYYPRLSESANDKELTTTIVNQQAEIAVLILAPLLTIFLIFINWAVIILYSTKFLPVTAMIHWAVLSIFFKAANWSMGFIFLAKGDTKWFFWNQLISVIYLLFLNVLGYKYFGLEGLGISILVGFIIAFVQNIIITKLLYSFKFGRLFYKIFITSFSLALACFLVSYFYTGLWMYILGIFFVTIATIYSYRELNKRIDIAEILITLKNKYIKK